MNKPDPITAELIRNSLQAIVDEMALTLVRTAYSANLKSAMDLSSAICDRQGRLIAEGLTLPLHLGSIPDAMQALLNRFGGAFRPGDAFVLNDSDWPQGGRRPHNPDNAQVAPESVPACESGGDTGISLGGYDAQRRAFVFLEFLVCSWGGRPFADGIDGVSSMVVNFSNYPAEVIEREYPLRIEEYGFMADSGGPGKFRGGLALVRRYRFLEESGTFQIRSDRSRFGAYGLAGGGPGRLSRNVLNPGPHEQVLPPKTTLHVSRGDELLHELAGAGGWGDPLERDPQAVLTDVSNDKVTQQHARAAYGVVLDTSGTRVDEVETTRLRDQLRRPADVGGT